MGNGFTGPPAVDFYSMLSGLGDTIARNRADQVKRDAFTAATTPGADGKIDYGKAILGLAQVDPQSAALFAARQNHEDTIAHQTLEDKRNAANDARSASQFQQTLALQKRVQDRLDDPTPSGFVRTEGNTVVPLAGGPADPAYLRDRAKAEAEAAIGKPIPFETLSGTRFLVRQPDGTYATVNPSAIGQPQPAPPVPGQPPVAPPTPVATAQPVSGPPSTPPTVGGTQPAVPGAPPQAAPQADLEALDPQTGRREAWLKSQPPDVQSYIKKIADYEIDPRTTSIKGGHREQVMSAVAQYDPTYDQNTFGSRSKAIRDFATGTQGNSIRSFDVAIDHLDTLQKYSDALKSGDVRLINSLRNRWLSETGSPLPTNVQAVAPIVGAEVSKAIIGSNNALADREELRKPLQIANSPEQISGAIQGYKNLMAGQLKGLKKQYEDTTGKKDFDKRIRDNTRNVLLGGEGGKSDPVKIDGYTITEH